MSLRNRVCVKGNDVIHRSTFVSTGPFCLRRLRPTTSRRGVLATRRPVRRWPPIQLLGAVAGAAGVGLVLAWLGQSATWCKQVALTPITRLWFAARWLASLRRGLPGAPVSGACLAAHPSSHVSRGSGRNMDVAEFPTPRPTGV
jgi:hypothetical protein